MTDGGVPLAYTEWILVELGGESVEVAGDTPNPVVVLDLEESRISGSAGVNRFTGTFALAEDELRFGPLATTTLAGPDAAMERERAFLDTPLRVTSYRLEGRELTLLAEDEAVARLAC